MQANISFRRLAVRTIPRFLYITAILIFIANWFGQWRWVESIINFTEFIFPTLGEDILTGLILIVIAHTVSRRKKIGWWAAVAYFTLETVSNLVILWAASVNFDNFARYISSTELAKVWTTLAIFIVCLVALILSRKDFQARLAARSIRQSVIVAIVGVLLTSVIGFALAFLLAMHRHADFSVAQALRHLLLSTNSEYPLVSVVTAIGLGVTAFFTLFTLLRAQAPTTLTDLEQELRLRELLDKAPGDSLSYFATRRDKGTIFADGNNAAITYRNLMGVCLLSGDPIGPQDHWRSAIKNALRYAAEQGLAPAVVGASKEGANAYAKAGLKARVIGDEAVLRPERFDLNKATMRTVRHAVNRVREAGYEIRVRRHKDLPEAELHNLIELADRWRQNGDDRGFSMALNRLGDPLDGDCVFVVAVDASGTPRGLLSFVPWGKDGLSLDVMRRDVAEAENGVTEFMVAGLMDHCRELGITQVSLNFAVLREVIAAGEDVGATWTQRLNRALIAAASRRFQIEQLYRSNLKYDPEWLPRYMCWRDTGDLATIGLAIGVAEGQISLPFVNDAVEQQPLYEADNPAIAEYLEASKTRVPERRLPEQVRQRMAIRETMLETGSQAYPASFDRTHTLAALADVPDGTQVAIAGRLIGVSDHGGVIFLRLQDWAGRAQAIVERDQMGVDTLRRIRRTLSIGDHVGISGVLGYSRTGTRSVLADAVELTSKSLRPLPRTLSNEETKVRQRYLDLIVNAGARSQVEKRSAVIQSLRNTLLGESFLEVETPLLQTIHGGANARPFKTHINAYNLGLYLRIAPELYLKRLMVGGVDRVFEIGRNFRNEGADATHNPEFTMLEAYAAYGDYNSMRELTRQLIINAAIAANGHTIVRNGEHEVDLSQPWRTITVHQGIAEAVGKDINPDTPYEELLALAEEHNIHVEPGISRGQLIIELHEELSEQYAIAPTFYTDFPTEVSPLTREHREDPRVAEKWDLICFGAEVATAYSELVDPVIQRQRLVEQSLLAAGGDPEAMEVDEDFLLALEYAMPPSGGMGMGVDRLVMMLTETNIRETIVFPLVKPQN